MTDPIDDVAFLARSENRVALLTALSEGPATKQSLTLGASTLGRRR